MGNGGWKWLGVPAAFLAVAVLAAPLVAGFLGHVHPALDSFSHLRIHLAAMLILMGLGLLIARMIALAAVASVVGIAAITITIGGFGSVGAADFATNSSPEVGGQATYRLLHLNLRYDNATPEKVLSLIGRTRPDIITLTEVSGMWQDRLSHIAHAYPHSVICPPPSRIGGVAILSRRPFRDSEPRCRERGAFVKVRIDLAGQGLDVAALHLGWPWPFDQPYRAPRMARLLSGMGETAIVAGDFNAVPWSWTVRSVARQARLRLVSGIGPTWLFLGMPDYLRRHVGLPIDHLLVRGGAVSRSVQRLEDVGSDHLPILQEFIVLPVERRQEVLRAAL